MPGAEFNTLQSRFHLIKFMEKVVGTFVGTSNQIALMGKKMTVGRSSRCDIIINDEKIEDRNTTFFIESDLVSVIDLDSVSGTFVNGMRIRGRNKLDHMDQVVIGNSKFLFVDRSYPFDPAVLEDYFNDTLPDIKSNYEYKLKQETMIGLHSGKLTPGMFNARGNEILQILEDIVSGNSLPELLEKIIDFLFRQFPVDRGFILLLNPQTKELAPVATRSSVKTLEKKGRLAISKTLIKKVMKEQTAILICDMGGIDSKDKTKSMLFHGFTSVMVAPIIFNGEIMGILQLDTIEHNHRLSEDDLEKLQVYTNVIALAIGNARMREQLWEEEHKRQALSRYLPRKLIEQVLVDETLIPPEGAQCEVAVFFADIRGFSTMCGRLPPRDIIEILNEYYNEVSDCIFEYSGMINQFVGDEIMAIFGGPWISDRDFNPVDAAVQASKDVIRQICKMNVERHETGKETIFIGAGIDYGSVIIGNLGSSKKFEFTAIGNTVVIASRLCSAAKESQILISDRVKDKASREFTMEKIEPIIAKNVKDPIEAYRVFWNR
ncbi:MAG: FHA domain-containing protein [Candidatus Eremiobacteraeota bacterium]|nr:FHA domain-containing protein [Candidatus Eremiobacteraeota bacterium]